MFGFGRKKQQRLVGAKEKLEQAKKLKGDYMNTQITSRREGGKEAGTTAPVLLVYFISTALAYVLTAAGPLKDGGGFNLTGIDRIDRIIFGPGVSSFTGADNTDFWITIALRGFGYFLLAGILPFATFLWMRLSDYKNNPLVMFWGVTAALPLLFFLGIAYVVPLVVELYKIFF